MHENKWLSYGELAWTETILASPAAQAEETGHYVDLLKAHARTGIHTLLHLGCGAGGNDFAFKKHFRVTGVDISEGMLQIARRTNPEVTYVHGDMRSIDLIERFDAVAIPDSIDYMVTLQELHRAIAVACRHLKPGGVLLIVAKTREEFRENNFCYTGTKDGIQITVFENNYIPAHNPSTYEATLVYLIRELGRPDIHTDRHTLGLFGQQAWLAALADAGLEVRQERLDGLYDPFIMGEGAYPMRAFVGIKPA
jgi:SAM-dependent methyltransferase